VQVLHNLAERNKAKQNTREKENTYLFHKLINQQKRKQFQQYLQRGWYLPLQQQ
jgi:hypothetical protein